MTNENYLRRLEELDASEDTSLLQSLEDLVDQLGREKITIQDTVQTIHSISEFYKQIERKENGNNN